MKSINFKLSPPALLLVLIFILHSINENYGLIGTPIVLKYLLKYSLISLLLAVASVLLFRNRNKGYIFSAFLMTIYFFFGAFHDFLENSGLSLRYSVILSLLLILSVIIAILIHKSKKNFIIIAGYVNLLCFVLLAIEIGTYGYHAFSKDEAKNNFGSSGKELASNYTPCDTCSKPDIYFIVFDAYSSSICLSEEFNFDNSGLDSFLLNTGFHISKRSNSNYAFTPLSINSTLNFDYLKKEINSQKIDGRFIVQSTTGLYESELPKILKKQGYAIKNYSLFNIKEYPVGDAEIHAHFKENIIHLQTLEGRIRRDLWGNLMYRLKWYSSKKKDQLQQTAIKKHTEKYILKNLRKTEMEIRQTEGPPKFVYTHLSFPHEPYVLDERGNYNDFSLIYKNKPQLYIKQVMHANTLIKELVFKLRSDSSREKIIILISDHGYREYKSVEKLPEIFKNLSCIYFPDRDYSTLYDSMSNVNIFRIVLNKYFNQQYRLLKDTSIYICDPSLTFERRKKKK